LTIGIPDFQLKEDLPIVDMDFSQEEGFCEFKLLLVPDAILNIKLDIEPNQEEDAFKIKQISISHELLANRALPEFVALTFRALFSLANVVSIYIPDANLSISTSFDYPLKEISRMLQNRQLAYRVMVIEKALGVDIDLPPNDISGEEVGTIAYAYHSIIDRVYIWTHVPEQYPASATQEILSGFPKCKEVSHYELAQNRIIKRLFDKDLDLGYQKAIIENAVIENYEEAKQELEKLDGHIVSVLIRSLNGLIKVESIDTPRLPENPWEPRIQQLIDLDSQLDAEMVRRYCELAAATLDGLSEEEKIAVTTRTEIDEDAFSIEE
jgi:hypothetical protein